jgi:uncharacterized protein involved in exopolysaccharide biosynthesis
MEEKEDIITIDFKALFKILWKEKLWIILITTIITIGGIWGALTAKEEFFSEGKMLPEVSNGSNSKLNGLAGLAALGGFDLTGTSSSEAIRPDLYPDVLKSTPFFLVLLNQKFVNRNGDSVRFEDFYRVSIEDNKKLKKSHLQTFNTRPKGVIVLNRQTELRIEDLKERITSFIDKKSGVISISVKLPDAILAAEVTKFAMQYLTDYVTDYRTEKIKQEVDFLGSKVSSAKGEYYKDQVRRANYSDLYSLPTIRLQMADMERERIESEYKMSSNVYTELLKKYEEAKIKLHQETPIFQILEPPRASNKSIEPKKMVYIFGSFIFGLLISIVFVSFLRGNYKLIFQFN